MNINNHKIIVLGPNGMLGQMVSRYFEDKGYEVVKVTDRFTPETKFAFTDKLKQPDAVVINCIGKIKQKTTNFEELLWANASLPLILNQELPGEQLLVHPSTDCVFDGKQGAPYKQDDLPDARDDYGYSKRLGEVALLSRKNTLIPRVSIIGPDQCEHPKGLLGWFLTHPAGSALKGFTDHYWNGITTLEWCIQVETYLKAHFEPGSAAQLLQFGTGDYHTKNDMLQEFQDVYDTTFAIEPVETGNPVDRRLVPDITVERTLKEQLMAIRDKQIKV